MTNKPVAVIDELKDNLALQQKATEQLERELNEVEAENKHLADNLDAIGSEANSLEEENSHLEGEIEKLTAEVKRLKLKLSTNNVAQQCLDADKENEE